MDFSSPVLQTRATLIGLCVAIGIGLLIGAERERRKTSTQDRSAAGIRTFTVAALLGAVGALVGGVALVGVAVLLVGAGALIAYQRTRSTDPGMTTEFALVLTCLLGALAIRDALLAAGIGAILALLLAARNRIHHFVRSVLSEQELHDIILFSATALIVLPLAPDRYMGPFGAINPHALSRLVVVVMAISAAGHVAMRWLGPKYGLPIAGFASGFVSSAATIHAMGQKASSNPAIMGAAVSGAVLSSVSTIVQMAVVIAMVQPGLLKPMATPLLLGGAVAALYALVILARSTREQDPAQAMAPEHAFNLKTSVAFAALLSVVLVLSAGLNASLGDAGMLLGAAASGFADAHATAASAASLLHANKIGLHQAMTAILVGLTTNTATKAFLAVHSGGRTYARRILPGLAAMLLALWLGFWLAL